MEITTKSGNTPQSGDNFTIRIVASATVDGTACTATHDLTIALTWYYFSYSCLVSLLVI